MFTKVNLIYSAVIGFIHKIVTQMKNEFTLANKMDWLDGT